MSMFDFNDPTKDAEEQMSDAVGCVVMAAVAAVALTLAVLIGFVYLGWKILHG